MARLAIVMLLTATSMVNCLRLLDEDDTDKPKTSDESKLAKDAEKKMKKAMTTEEANMKPEKYTFKDFVIIYRRQYKHGTAEYHEREKIFKKNLDKVVLQRKIEKHPWKAGVNKFLDWTWAEKKKLLGHKPDRSRKPKEFSNSAAPSLNHTHTLDMSAELPESIDWSTHPSLKFSASYIRDQGACGSCWAVSTASLMEAYLEKSEENVAHLTKEGYYNKFSDIALSSQSLVSCAPNLHKCGGTGGCEGSTQQLAFDHIHKKGMPWGNKYFYTSGSGDSGKCNTKHPGKVFIENWIELPSNEQAPLLQAIVQSGPVGVSVAANNWFHYNTGVFDACYNDASSDSLATGLGDFLSFDADYIVNHAVVAFGFGKTTGTKPLYYWLIKNSWGEEWGEKGFIRLKRTPPGERSPCGTDTDPQAGLACEGETDPVTVCGHCGVEYSSSYPVGVHIV